MNLAAVIQKVDTENNILDQIEHYGGKCKQLFM